jgi:hypothetical protein
VPAEWISRREIPVPDQVMKVIEERCGGWDRDAFVLNRTQGRPLALRGLLR